MTPFRKPSVAENYRQLGVRAGLAALADAGVDYRQIQQVYAGYVYGDSTAGQSVAYELGLSGVPIINVNNNCATGSSALFLARQLVELGGADCVLALGFEQMRRGALTDVWEDRPSPLDRFLDRLPPAADGTPMAARFFAGAGQEHAERYGTSAEAFASISVKARRHAAQNPSALFRTPLTVEEVLASDSVHAMTTRLQCCPPTCGAAAAVVVSSDFLARASNRNRAVRIAAQAMTTDTASTFGQDSAMSLVGYDMARAAADQVYAQAGVGPEDIDVAELHDCFTANELISYEALRFTPEGTAERFISDGDNSYGGRIVTNPSGGLLAKGHPLGATGLAQCAELTWQLRGEAGPRQVDGARIALQHNLGLGGACVVTLYEKAAA
jgi:acetyl-CoA acyltransferase